MNRRYAILLLIVLNLTYSVKVFAGTLSPSGAQQDEWTVRFNLKNTENEPVNDYFGIDIYNDNYNYAGYVNSFNPEIKLLNGTYTYNFYSSLLQLTDSFTVKDGDKNVDIVFNKVRFHFSGQDGIEKGLIVQIRRADNTYSSIEINTDSSGYSSTNLLT